MHFLLQHEKEQHHPRIQTLNQEGNLHYITLKKGSVVTLLYCRGVTELQLLITNCPSPVLQYFVSLSALLPPALSFQSTAVL